MGLSMHGLQAVLAGNDPIVPDLGLEIVPRGILYLMAFGCPSVGSLLMGPGTRILCFMEHLIK